MKKQKNAPQILPREEWPYEVPENWVWTRLENISQTISKGTTPAGGKTVYTSKGIPFLRVENILDNGIISHKNIQYISKEIHLGELKRSILQENDVLVSIAGTLAKTTIISCDDVPMNTNQAIAFIRLHETMKKQSKFIKWAFSSPVMQKLLLTQTKVTAIPNLTLKILSEAPIPLPPLPEQQRIVARIESLFAKLDAAAEKIRAALDQFPIRKAAILHKAFTGELTKNWREENGVGMESWKNSSFGDITNIKSSKRIFKDEYVKSGIPFFRGSEIVELHDKGYTIPKYFISETRYNELAKNNEMPSTGDLLVTSVGTIGKTWIVDERRFYYKDGNITLIEKRDNFDMCYIQYYCESGIFNSTIHNTVAGSAYNALTIVKFKKIVLPIPSLPEQKEIVRILDAIFEREQAAKETAERLLEQIALTKKSILARAFRGLLGTNDPKEESAEGWLNGQNN